MRRTLVSALAVALLLGVAIPCLAQDAAGDAKPLVVVSFAGYDAILADAGYVGALAGNPELGKGLEATLQVMTQGQGLAGLDTKRPWGAVVETNEQGFGVYGFVPVSDAKALVEALEGLGVKQKDAAGGAMEIEAPNMDRPVFVQQKGDWAFVCASPEALAKAPSDPVKALGGLDRKYDLAVRVLVKNVPEPFRQMLAAQMRMASQVGAQQLGEQEAQQFAARIERVITVLNELDTLTIGWAIDSQAGNAYLDVDFTALPGTKLAEQFAGATQQTTNFAGFALPDAAIRASVAGTLTEDQIARYQQTIGSVRDAAQKALDGAGLSEDQTKEAEALLDDLFAVHLKTIQSGKMDSAGSLRMNSDGSLSLVVGGYVADGKKLEQIVKDAVAMAAEKDPGVAEMVQLDAGTYEGIPLHRFSIPAPPGPEGDRIGQWFGEKIEGVLGIAEQSVYLAVGSDAEELLKQAVSRSKAEAGKQAPPLEVVLSATALEKLVARVAEDPEVQMTAGLMGTMLQQAGDEDHITFTSEGTPNGAHVRVEFERGILKAIGSMGRMVGPGGPPAGM